MWRRFKNVLGIVLALIGISLLGITVFIKYDTHTKQQAILNGFKALQSYSLEDSKRHTKNLGIENTKEGRFIDKTKFDYEKVIGILNIPKINLEIAIVEGVKSEDIKYLVGHFPESKMPGEVGNFSIAGHRISYFGQAFRNIHKLKEGDRIIVTYKGREYKYEITNMYEVSPSETEALNQTKYATITIVTCTIDTKRRVIVKGRLV